MNFVRPNQRARSSQKIRGTILTVSALAAFFMPSVRPATAAAASLSVSWWRSLNQVEQSAAVAGAIYGYSAGTTRGVSVAITDVASGPSLKLLTPKSAREYYQTTEKVAALQAYPIYSHTILFYVAAVSDFYDRYPRSSYEDLGVIIGCLADNPSKTCDAIGQSDARGR